MATHSAAATTRSKWVRLIDRSTAPAVVQTPDGASQSKKFLIVDDDIAIRSTLSHYLIRQGHVCVEAADAERALELLTVGNFDAILVDVCLPEMDGLELLRIIRNLDPDLAVVTISGNHDQQNALRAFKLGADDFLFKPFTAPELSLGLGRALQKRSLKLKVRRYQENLETLVATRTSQVQRLLNHVIESLVTTLEAKDSNTDGHSQRVTLLSVQLAESAGLSRDEIETVELGAMFHDLGKLGINDDILQKRGPLTQEEHEHIRQHCDLGVRILEPLEELRFILPIVRHHHEHYDGTGYPSGLAGDQIPLEARIVAIADAFDAMSSTRPYRAALDWSEAIARIRRGAGTQFDPRLASLFISLVERRRLT